MADAFKIYIKNPFFLYIFSPVVKLLATGCNYSCNMAHWPVNQELNKSFIIGSCSTSYLITQKGPKEEEKLKDYKVETYFLLYSTRPGPMARPSHYIDN